MINVNCICQQMQNASLNHDGYNQQQHQDQTNMLVNKRMQPARVKVMRKMTQTQLYWRRMNKNAFNLELKIIATAIFLTIVLVSFYIATAITRTDLSKKPFVSKPNIENKGYLMMNNQKNTQQVTTSSEKPVVPNINYLQPNANKLQWHPTPASAKPFTQQSFQYNNPNQRVSRATLITPQQKQAAKSFKLLKDLPLEDPLATTQLNYYQQKYQISSYSEELPFCIVIPSYNNAKDNRVQNNFNSIKQQNYSNYRVYFINDASTDNTGQIAQKYLNKNPDFKQKVTVQTNQIQHYALPNILKAARQFCKPEQIFVIVDGDDQIIGRQVFKLFNAQFQKSKAYFIYSNFLNSRGSVGYSRPFREDIIINNNYRKAPLLTSHLRAFYTQLLLLIDDKDLRNRDGQYFHAANDVAICLPILEMSHRKVQYLPQLTYYYNSATGLNNHATKLKEQKQNDRFIRSKNHYSQFVIDFEALQEKGHDQKVGVKKQQQKVSQRHQIIKDISEVEGTSEQLNHKSDVINGKENESMQDIAHIDQINRENANN